MANDDQRRSSGLSRRQVSTVRRFPYLPNVSLPRRVSISRQETKLQELPSVGVRGVHYASIKLSSPLPLLTKIRGGGGRRDAAHGIRMLRRVEKGAASIFARDHRRTEEYRSSIASDSLTCIIATRVDFSTLSPRLSGVSLSTRFVLPTKSKELASVGVRGVHYCVDPSPLIPPHPSAEMHGVDATRSTESGRREKSRKEHGLNFSPDRRGLRRAEFPEKGKATPIIKFPPTAPASLRHSRDGVSRFRCPTARLN